MSIIGNVWVIPFLTGLFGYAAIFIPYYIGVTNKHVPLVLPFISDCGAYPPESCIFSQLLNTTAFFFIITVYLRHRQIVEYYGNRLRRYDIWWRRLSLILVVIGIASAIFVTGTGSFSTVDQFTVHNICASFTFVLGTIYVWGQVFLSFALVPRMSSPLLNWIRLFLVLLGTISLAIQETALYTDIFYPNDHNETMLFDESITPFPIFVDRNSSLFIPHTIAAASEWSMVIFQFAFILSMSLDLRYTYVRPPKVFFKKTQRRVITDDTTELD